MRQTRFLIFALACFGFCCLASAQSPKVRATLDKPEYWLGERMQVTIELLVPGYFDGTPAFDVPPSGALLLLPPAGHPVLSTEEIDGTTYTVQRHDLSAYARRASVTEIPAFEVRVEFKRQPLDKTGEPATLQTPALPLKVKMPAGVGNLSGIISTRNLKVDESWTPEPVRAIVGNAFTRTVTFSAPATPGMAFPPIPKTTIDGFSVYHKPPVVNDHDDRGDVTGERIDTIVYVCTRPGKISIPTMRFTWFDLESEQLQHVVLPARELDVEPVFDAKQAEAAVQSARIAKRRTLICVMVFAAGIALLAIAIRKWWDILRAPFAPVHLAPLNPRPDGKP